MKERLSKFATPSIFFLGTLAALSNWLWAKGFIALWILLWLFAYSKPRALIVPIQNVLSFIALAVSIGGIGMAYLSPLHPFFILLFWLCVFIYTVFLFKKRETTPTEKNEEWPSRFHIFLFALIFGGGTPLFFSAICVVIDRPFVPSWGTSLTWAAAGILFAYPRSISIHSARADLRIAKWLAPFSIGLIIIYHAIASISIDCDLNTADSNHKSLAPIAELALQKGYLNTGMKGVRWHTSALFHQEGWEKAVAYHRSMWRLVDKERLAYSFLSNSVLDDNLFLFTTCYGCNLALNPSERAVDFDVVTEKHSYWVLTNQRLIQIGTKGWETAHALTENPVALSISKESGSFAILNASGSVQIIQVETGIQTIALPNERVWKDIVIDSVGNTFWTLDGNGRIEKYAMDANAKTWLPQGEIYPALWGDPKVARAFFPGEQTDAFYILDAANGIHYRSNPPIESDTPFEKRLLHYYNQNRQVAANLGFWKPLSSITMLEKTGRILFIPISNHFESSLSNGHISDPTPQFPTPVESLLYYDPTQADWYRKMESVALVALPEVNTIVTLQRDGTLQAIAMPQRFFIRFVHPESFRLIDKSGNG